MLVFVMVVATTLRLCPLARAQPLCRMQTVRTGKIFHDGQKIQGDLLYFSSATTRLIKHPCKKNIALYLGRQAFLTRDNFESSLLPLSIPEALQVSTPEVTSAHFAGSVLLLVVNQEVYIYDYEANSWNASKGIEHPVSHISGDNCCYSGNSFCADVSNSVFAYLRGDQISQTNIYFSNTQGYVFQKYAHERQAELVGSLGGIFYFHSLSQVGLLLVNQQKAMFSYSDYPLNLNFGLPFDYNGTLDILIAPGQKGILIFWCEKSLLVSQNAGQLVNPVQVREGQHVLYSSISEANISVHSVAANENELAVLTQESYLYYGSLGILPSSLIKFAGQNIRSEEAVLVFTDVGMLEILSPLPDPLFPAFDFQKCPVNIQATLMDPQLQVDVCKMELLQGEFDNKMYTIDMNSKLELRALMIPRTGTSPVSLVMASNPHSLGLQALIYEDGYTLNGNTKHRLNISLRQQHHGGRADPNFTSSIKRPTMSTVTLDIANKEISCVDLKPLTALISVGCDLEKKIIIQNEISACYNGLLDLVTLQDNYSYVIEKDTYDPNFQGQKATEDLVVHYQYEKLGCPVLVFYDTPWKPVVELWREGKFQEVVETEYVLLEVNGLFTYTYSLTAAMALCSSQPQNWTTISKAAGGKGPFAWNRENYVSCHNPDNSTPLRWPQVPYQILGGPTENKVVFEKRNGIYTFFISIVDPYYSYCHLETIFSVYVSGAYPEQIIPEVLIFILIAANLMSVWLAYKIPKLLHTERGLKVKGFCINLCRRCRKPCECFRGRR
ncbi:cation channel sperm-associated protein subunit delta isoform X1 [Camelus ferus]|uniref:Cation channel sperm-associated auxiliary subunit delta n=2 Tax=Camelus TaxID=9836 RepID=A0A8B6YCT5_CAMFR|nr:cation channel sperm-associated protein subunit delta isoform X1 [Camelus ferus]XP_010981662.2 cation channel sperm-associated protein subunit delta isoform X2 [Camelus dromedarius]